MNFLYPFRGSELSLKCGFDFCGASLTMCGTCCMCAVTFTLDGPKVLGSSCLATGAAVGCTVTKDRTPKRRHEKASNEESSSPKLHCPLSSGYWYIGLHMKKHLPCGTGKLYCRIIKENNVHNSCI